MCGEKAAKQAALIKAYGITPACAGKSFPAVLHFGLVEDHPRVCGEKFGAQQARNLPIRITPACAGKSGSRSRSSRPVRDHPRVCGEKCFSVPVTQEETGSPPRVRGKVRLSPPRLFPAGITPACAGKSFPASLVVLFCRDHPRVCGEKFSIVRMVDSELGSPPRVRGKV